MKKIAVILSGCGYLDGSEITEAVSTLVALSLSSCVYSVFAPDIKAKTLNHLTQTDSGERSILAETCRITRGQTQPLNELNPENFDGLAIPGGFGVAKSLCTWATDGSNCSIDPTVQKVIKTFHADSKPILAICIAPALVSRVLGSENITVTIGNDPGTIKEIEKTGAAHEVCPVDDYLTDRLSKIVSTPAYMYDNASPGEVFTGISKAVKEFVEMS